jgi:hypothetical protein
MLVIECLSMELVRRVVRYNIDDLVKELASVSCHYREHL